MKRFIVLLAIIMGGVILICQSVYTKESSEVIGTVTDMEYNDSYTTFISVYNAGTKTPMLIPQKHPAQYLVTITYEGISETFDDQTLYESVKEGDAIQIVLYKYYDKNDDLIKQNLQLPEWPFPFVLLEGK